MANTDYLLAVEDLTVSFDGFKAVDDLNLYVDQNELRVIIGPNGAGKTTLLDLICGKTRATAGSIKFKDQELTRMREHKIVRAGIGRKFQTPSIYENLTRVREPGDLLPARAQRLRRAVPSGARADVEERVAGGRRGDLPAGPAATTEAGLLSATARSSGWRSACC